MRAGLPSGGVPEPCAIRRRTRGCAAVADADIRGSVRLQPWQVRKLDDARAACTRSPSWLGVGHQRSEPKVVAALRGEDWLHGGPAAELGLIGDLQLVVSGADACGFRRYAGCMRYTQGGGLTAEGRRRLEQVRLEAVKRSGTA
jgi:hypothetical protein